MVQRSSTLVVAPHDYDNILLGDNIATFDHLVSRSSPIIVHSLPVLRPVLTHAKKCTCFQDLLAVQTAKTICSESKKRNMTRREMEAPTGRNIA